MRIWLILILMALLLIFSACAIRKPASPVTATSVEEYDFHFNEGKAALQEGDYRKAIDHLKKAVAAKPNSARAHNLLGIAHFQQKDYKLAKTQYERAVDLDPSYALAYNNLAGAHFMLGELDKAKEMFKKALSLSPELVSAHYSLGTLLVVQGQVEEGTHYLLKAIELSPEYLEKHQAFVAGFASSTLGTPELFFIYAKLYASTGNVEKTIEYLTKAKKAGFKDWQRIDTEKEFESLRENPRIQDFKRMS